MSTWKFCATGFHIDSPTYRKGTGMHCLLSYASTDTVMSETRPTRLDLTNLRAWIKESIEWMASSRLATFTEISIGTQSDEGYADCGRSLWACYSYACCACSTNSPRRQLLPISTAPSVCGYVKQTFAFIPRKSPYLVAWYAHCHVTHDVINLLRLWHWEFWEHAPYPPDMVLVTSACFSS